MAAGVIKEPLLIDKGATCSRLFRTGLDLTDCTATAHLYRGSPTTPGGAPALECDTDGERLTIESPASAGVLRCVFSAADTAGLAVGDYWQELWITFVDTTKERPFLRYAKVRPTGSNP